jgi:hypothetical protein
MKFKDDEWLTDYVNSLHFTVRFLEEQTHRDAAISDVLKDGANALLQEAILGHIPMEVFTIQRISERMGAARSRMNIREIPDKTPLETYNGDTSELISDYNFICKGFEEFTLEDVIQECAPYFERIYPDIQDIKATITEIFQKNIEMGLIEEIKPGVWRYVSGIPDIAF